MLLAALSLNLPRAAGACSCPSWVFHHDLRSLSSTGMSTARVSGKYHCGWHRGRGASGCGSLRISARIHVHCRGLLFSVNQAFMLRPFILSRDWELESHRNSRATSWAGMMRVKCQTAPKPGASQHPTEQNIQDHKTVYLSLYLSIYLFMYLSMLACIRTCTI